MQSRHPVWGFENIEAAREYLAKYLLNYIHIELESLPKEEWDKTLKTWAKMCMFAQSLVEKSDEERNKLYQKYNFDQVMIGVIEDLRHTIIGAKSLQIITPKDKAYKVIQKAIELVLEKEDMLKSLQLKKEILEHMLSFFKSNPKL